METSASPQGFLRTDRRDGGHVIAEYDDSGLLRKYIYGPSEGWQPQASLEKAGRAWGWIKDNLPIVTRPTTITSMA